MFSPPESCAVLRVCYSLFISPSAFMRSTRELERGFLARVCCNRKRVMVLNWKRAGLYQIS